MRARRIECKGAEIMKRQAWKRMQAWLLVVAMLVSVVTGIGTTKTAKAATKMGVTYTVHVQTYGEYWFSPRSMHSSSFSMRMPTSSVS